MKKEHLALCALITWPCTYSCALQWVTNDGTSVSLGTVWTTQQTLSSGTRFVRRAIGLDIRIGGPEPGVGLGWTSTTQLTPTLHAVPVSRLGAQLHQHLTNDSPPPPAAPGSWALFFSRDRHTDRATVIRSKHVGMHCCAHGADRFTLGAGIYSTHYLHGLALQPGIVQVYEPDPHDPDLDRLDLWVLSPEQDPQR